MRLLGTFPCVVRRPARAADGVTPDSRRGHKGRVSGSPDGLQAHIYVRLLPGPGVRAHAAGWGCLFSCPVALVWESRALWLIVLSESQPFAMFLFLFWSGYGTHYCEGKERNRVLEEVVCSVVNCFTFELFILLAVKQVFLE